MRGFVLFTVVALSQAAYAQEGSTAPESAPPKWSIGTGVGFFESGYVIAGLVGGLGAFYSPITPTPRVSFERVFSDSFSLGLGLTSDYQSGQPTRSGISGTSVATVFRSSSVALSLMPRWILTGPAAPVAFSVYAAAIAGYSSMSLGNPNQEPQGGSSFSFGLSGGVAVERRLMDRLALRIQAQMIRATLGRNSVQTTATQDVLGSSVIQTGTVTQVSASPSPSVELRLYF